ncbi:PREDICTED: cytochrome P450 3A14-like [Rhagoletis zephyria]|uniref:cytochrome P450 3A14-like n=1 Tax=Rhagoletis zephyria TaxID=28612 RepID=UPI0008115322|nr:PREDICTED: cytochrome P450 3A14-like [Rhagoletis zephyria]
MAKEGDDNDSATTSSTKKSTGSTTTTKSLTDNEIIANCILFFVAGFETTASTLSHALFELARHPEAQARLAEELKSAIQEKEVNSEHFINSVLSDKETPYLEAVIKETLRLYPPVPRLNRRVAVDGYRLGGVELKKDMGVEIPAYAVHRHPDYYGPEPERFNPDRCRHAIRLPGDETVSGGAGGPVPICTGARDARRVDLQQDWPAGGEELSAGRQPPPKSSLTN